MCRLSTNYFVFSQATSLRGIEPFFNHTRPFRRNRNGRRTHYDVLNHIQDMRAAASLARRRARQPWDCNFRARAPRPARLGVLHNWTVLNTNMQFARALVMLARRFSPKLYPGEAIIHFATWFSAHNHTDIRADQLTKGSIGKIAARAFRISARFLKTRGRGGAMAAERGSPARLRQ